MAIGIGAFNWFCAQNRSDVVGALAKLLCGKNIPGYALRFTDNDNEINPLMVGNFYACCGDAYEILPDPEDAPDSWSKKLRVSVRQGKTRTGGFILLCGDKELGPKGCPRHSGYDDGTVVGALRKFGKSTLHTKLGNLIVVGFGFFRHFTSEESIATAIEEMLKEEIEGLLKFTI